MENRRRTGFISVLLIILCLSVCIGATYAYFTDSVESKNNIIKAGKLDVTMEWANGTADPTGENTAWMDASTGAIFNYDLWEPGYTDVRHIRIKNVGNLAFQYKLVIVANGEVTELADVIDVYYFDPAIQVADRAALANVKSLGTLTAALAGMGETATGNLKAGESVTITIALKMQEDADNKYQELSIGTDFSIQLHATQYTHESDAFDENYDAGACLHSTTRAETVPPTYFAEGSETTICATCGKTISTKTLDKLVEKEYPDLIFTLHEGEGAAYYSVRGKLVGGDGYYIENTDIFIPGTYCGIPVREIEYGAFNDCNLEKIVISEGVTSIDNRAFYSCYDLASVTLPESLVSIGNDAFHGCSVLSGIAFGSDLTIIGKDAFNWCGSLTDVIIPDNVTTIGEGAFAFCESLRNVTIGSGVTSIGQDAFGYNDQLNLDVEGGVSYIGKWIVDCDESATSVVLRNDTVGIVDGAFSNCNNLTSAAIDEGSTPFYVKNNCIINAETKTLAAGFKNSVIPEEVTSIQNCAFYCCFGLTSVTLPEGVTSIGDRAFYMCYGLENIDMPAGLVSIGDSAFSECTALTSITIPHGVTNIGNGAFSCCRSLTSITIPSSVTSITHWLFNACANLKSVEILGGLKSIGEGAFYECEALTSITFKGTVDQWNDINFGYDWHYLVPATEVVCSNGNVEIPHYEEDAG